MYPSGVVYESTCGYYNKCSRKRVSQILFPRPAEASAKAGYPHLSRL